MSDRIAQTFSNFGMFGPRVVAARFRARAAQIDQAMLGESARWGDARRPTAPLTHQDWRGAIDRVVRGYFPVRTRIVLNQFRGLGLLPGAGRPRIRA